jgi:GNAT superfamily N-acetyltransferase
VFRWLSVESYWAAGRPRDVVERSLAGSLCAGVYDSAVPGSPQVALARAVTDDATFAWLCDVYVDEGARGRGIGTWLMRELVAELVDRRGIERLLLATRDAHQVYARVGFTALNRPERWMEVDQRETGLPPPA